MTAIELVNKQAEDEGLWFINPTITEDYLQRALRELHAVVENDAQEACFVNMDSK